MGISTEDAMKFIALVLSIVALAAIGYCVVETAGNYEYAREEFLKGSSGKTAMMASLDDMMYYSYRETMQTEVLVAGGAGVLALLLGLLARRRDGGLPALLAILFALGSFGGVGYVLAEYNPF